METTQYDAISFFKKRVKKDFEAFDAVTAQRFITQLEMIAWGEVPNPAPVELKHSVGDGAFELKRNGKPAKRCIYVVEKPGKVVVLHVFKKTCDDVDKKNMDTAKKRYKAWLATQKQS